MLWLVFAAILGTTARAGDSPTKPAPGPKPQVVTEIEVVPQFQQGSVKLTMPGRDGDPVYIDGWNAGTLPVETDLAEGPHVFRVEGPAGKHEVSIYVTVAKDKVTMLDLTNPVAAPPPPPVLPTSKKKP